jgi:RNA polymerase sigma-70 factor (ECF subfamily)
MPGRLNSFAKPVGGRRHPRDHGGAYRIGVLAFAAVSDGLPLGEEGFDERALAQAIRAGDTAAFELVVRTFGGRLLAVTRRMLRNEEDARDAVQEAFVSAYRARERFEASARVSTWLHRIAVNAALMKLRTRRRKPETAIDELLPAFDEEGHHAVQVRAWTEASDQALMRRETHDVVHRAVDQLPDAYRAVLVLRDFEELDTEETAALLGITPNAAKIRLHRARLALRTLLAPHFGGQACP